MAGVFDQSELTTLFTRGVELKFTQRSMITSMSNTNYEGDAANAEEVDIVIPDTANRTITSTEATTDATRKSQRNPAVPAAEHAALDVVKLFLNKRHTASQAIGIDDLGDHVYAGTLPQLLVDAVALDMISKMDSDFITDVRKSVPVANIFPAALAVENDPTDANFGITATATDQEKMFVALRQMQARLQNSNIVDTGDTSISPYMMMSPSNWLALTLADIGKDYLTLLEGSIQSGAALNNAQVTVGRLFGFDIRVTNRIGTVTEGTDSDVATNAANGKTYDPIVIGVPQAVTVAAKAPIAHLYTPGSDPTQFGWRGNFYRRWGYKVVYDELLYRLDIETR